MANLYEDMLARLMAGESADDIAAGLTKDLNKAMAEAAKKRDNSQKEQDAADIWNAAQHYLHTYYPDCAIPVDLTGAEVVELIDECVPYLRIAVKMLGAAIDAVAEVADDISDNSDPLQSFLDRFVH